MAIPAQWTGSLTLPVIAAPMFLASGPDLVVETCAEGAIGTFPSLNQRTSDGYAAWLDDIAARLAARGIATPYGVNLIVHKSNPRLAADLEITVKHKVPLVITSLGAVRDVADAVHSYGGLLFHDVVSRRHAEKAAEAGADGIIAVAAGAGGHAGTMSPFALVAEIASFFKGTIVLSGAVTQGAQVAAARLMGADLVYVGTRFLATRESMVEDGFKRMLVECSAADIVYTPNISGVHANFLRPSLVAAGLDPDALPARAEIQVLEEAKAWKKIWSAGHGVGSIADLPGAMELCRRLRVEYEATMARAAVDPFAGRN
jgi:nitronate monooxygenase